MGYEIFSKVTRVATEPKVSIGKKLGRIQFNSSAAKILADGAVEYALVMWDKDNRTIAVKGIGKKDARAYTVRFAKKGNGAGFAAKAFLHHIGYDLGQTRSFECVWNEELNMFEFAIPDGALKVTETGARNIRPSIRGGKAESEAKGHVRATA